VVNVVISRQTWQAGHSEKHFLLPGSVLPLSSNGRPRFCLV
jgi:hypothetical protein